MSDHESSIVAEMSCGPLRPEYLQGPLFHEAFAAAAAQRPDRRCLVFEGAEMSYGKVDAASDAVARTLVGKGIGAGSTVGIMLERSFDLIVAILGALKAGGRWLGGAALACGTACRCCCPVQQPRLLP